MYKLENNLWILQNSNSKQIFVVPSNYMDKDLLKQFMDFPKKFLTDFSTNMLSKRSIRHIMMEMKKSSSEKLS